MYIGKMILHCLQGEQPGSWFIKVFLLTNQMNTLSDLLTFPLSLYWLCLYRKY